MNSSSPAFQTRSTQRPGPTPGFPVAILALLLSACPGVVMADDYFWSSPAGGSFQQETNWGPDFDTIPGPGDAAIFDLDATYTVGLSGDVENERLEAADGEVTLDLGGHEYTTTFNFNLSDQLWGMMIAGNTNEEATLTIQGGTLNTVATVIGAANGASGSLVVTGSTTVWNNPSIAAWDQNSIGFEGGSGSLRIENGATANFGSMAIGYRDNAVGSVTVTGAGTTLNLDGGWNMGFNNDTTSQFEVSDGAEVNFSEVTGRGNWNAIQMLQRSQSEGSSVSLIVDNATFNTETSARIGNHGGASANAELIIRNGGVFTMTRIDSLYNSGDGITAGNRTNSLIRVETGGELIVISNDINLGIDVGFGNGGVGVMEVLSGGQVTTNRLRLAYTHGTAEGTLRVFGNNSQVSVGPGGLSFGNSSGGTGTLEIGDQGFIDIMGNLTFVENSGSIYSLTLSTGQFSAGVSVGNRLHLFDANLVVDLAPGFNAQIDDVFQILAYTPDPDYNPFFGPNTDEQFNGFGEGDIVTVGLYEFRISYSEDLAGFITLTTVAIPEPGAMVLSLFGVVLLLRRFRR